MKTLFLSLNFLFLTIGLKAQIRWDSIQLYHQIHQLEKGLIQKDTAILKTILHDQLTLGHSNAWIESKNSLLENLPTSNIHYQSFTEFEPSTVEIIHENLIWIRRNILAKGMYKTYNFDMKLKVLEVWIKVQDRWQLLARQSVEFKP